MSEIQIPKVSVVIPTYNSAKYLPQALDSVLQQTYTDYEIIAIDDGSTDNTRAVIEPYLAKIHYVYQENQGVAAARNRGIELAKGELIAFLDADDLFLPDKLQAQVAIFEAQPDLGMVVSGWQIVDERGKVISDVKMWDRLPQLDLEAWIHWKPVLPSATMIRRHWLQQVDGFPDDTIPVEDVECFLNLIALGCRAEWCRQIGVLYRRIDPNSLSNNTLRQVKSSELVHQRFFVRADLPKSIRQAENKIRHDNYVWSAWRLYQNGYKTEILDYLRKSLSYTIYSAAQISVNWIKYFEAHCNQHHSQLDSYALTQIPGWQELMVEALGTKQPRVSVIIPAYNSAKYLPEAIESVFNQTYTDYEIIVINDGSTDNTNEVVKPYLDQIRYFEQENQGVSETRNRGIYLARGELIAFLDADDIFMPYKLKEKVAVFDARPEIGIVNSGFRIIEEDGTEVMDVERWREIPDLTPEIWLLHKPVLPSAMMFRRQWLERVNGFDRRFFASEDVDITLRMVARGCQGAWLPKVTVYYRRHNQSATWRDPIKQMANAEQMQECFFARSDLPESMRRLERRSRYDFLVWIAYVLYHAGAKNEMATYLQKSLEYSPYSWSETIANWVVSFKNCAKLNNYVFDAYRLSQLPEWQQVVRGLQVSQVFNHYSQQVSDYQQLLNYQPEAKEAFIYAETYARLGGQLASQNNLNLAVTFLRKALELEPQNCWYHDRLSRILVLKYDLAEAIATRRKAIRLKPDYPPFKEQLAEALKLQHRWQQVVDYCQQAMTAIPQENSLKMLMIFPYPPYPPQKGGAAIRMFEQIKYFGSRHQLTVVSFVFSDADYIIEEKLAPYCDRAIMVKLGSPLEPYQEGQQNQLYNFKTWNMWKTLEQLSQIDFDVVLFDFIVSATYHSLFSDRFTVLNEHNIESKLLKRCAEADSDNLIPTLAEEIDAAKPFLNAEKESQLLEKCEARLWRKFSLRTVVSPDDKQELDRRCHVGRTIVVKNGINTHSIEPVENEGAKKLLYMGTMTYYPNIDAVLYFVEQIQPYLKQDSTIPLCIAGREPPQIIYNLATPESAIEIIADPVDMSSIAAQCQIAIVPLRLGSGTRIKILHAMAMGLPVVSTSLGCEGLEVTHGEHLLISDRPEEFARAILKLNSERQLWQKLRTNGRKLVEEKYDWQQIFTEYEREIVKAKSAWQGS